MAIWCATAATTARQSSAAPFTLVRLGNNVWAAISDPRSKAPSYANAGIVIGADSVAVIDTFGSVESATALLAAIRTLTSLPVRFVISTHYHIDHTGGNGVFAAAGASVIAHRNVRTWIRSENLRLVGADAPSALRAAIEALPLPAITLDGSIELDLGSRTLLVRAFPGHTGGDVVAMVPDARVAFAGDLFWQRTIPTLIDATTATWVQTLGALTKTLPGYSFVPGHGDVGSAVDVVGFQDYLAMLRQSVIRARRQGRAGDGLVKTVMPMLATRYAAWDSFAGAAPLNISTVEAELSGRQRIPQAPVGPTR